MIYLRLFFEFCLIGLCSVGGGLATLPFLQHLGERTGWFTAQNLADMVAVSESTPGPLGVNMATYVGFHVGGVPGGIMSTLGLIFPSIVIILIIARILVAFRDNKYVMGGFEGLRPASTALIAVALVSIFQMAFGLTGLFSGSFDFSSLLTLKMLISVILCVGSFILARKTKIHPVALIAVSAVVGIIFKL